METNKKKRKRLEIRVVDVPPGLYNSIQNKAKEEGRSMGNEILKTIKITYKWKDHI